MKKYLFAIVILAAATLAIFSSCGANTDQNTALKAPDTTVAIIPAPNPGAENEEEDADENKTGAATSEVSAAKAATIKNLLTAFAGETTASAKYAAYSKKAQEEGFTQIALLFKATSESEKVHANNHRSVLEDLGETVPTVQPVYTVKATGENLADAIQGESYEINTMYPEFLAAANTADIPLALTSLNYAYRTEQRHKPLYEKALAALESNQLSTLSALYYVCPTCGNTYDTTPPKRCRISMTNSERFMKINAV